MIHFLLGQQDKNSYIFEKMRENGKHRKQLLIVPELYSHEYERMLCHENDGLAYSNLQVSSFTHLANTVFAEVGGLSKTYLTKGGRALIMRHALTACDSLLKIYKGAYNKIDVLDSICDVIDEFICYNIEENTLFDCIELSDNSISDKLYELALIYSAYLGLMSDRVNDMRKMLVSLAEKIPECTIFDDADVYFTGFFGYTPVEFHVITAIINKTNSATFAMNFDPNFPDILPNTNKTYLKLQRITQGKYVEILEFSKNESTREESLNELLRKVLGMEKGKSDSKVPCEIYAANEIYNECLNAAAKIRKFVSENNIRYRDVTVAARNFDNYNEIFAMICEKYDIPIYISKKSDIVSKPIINLILSALSAVNKDFLYEDVFSCLKTSLWNIENSDIHKLENYVLTWNIKGKKWFSPFTAHPDGYGRAFDEQSENLLKQINATREKVAKSLKLLHESQKSAINCAEMCKSIYEFLLGISVPDKIIRVAKTLKDNDQTVLSDEYVQIWDILIDAFDEICEISGEDTMTNQTFYDILRLILTKYDIGTIPVSMDMVNCGNIDRVCHLNVDYLIILGANDGVFPSASVMQGLLSDDDREKMNAVGIELAEFGEDRYVNENRYVFEVFNCVQKRLYISYCKHEGKSTLKSSFILDKICHMFSNITVTEYRENDLEHLLYSKKTALELALTATNGRILTKWHTAAYEHFKHSEIFKEILGKSSYKPRKIANTALITALYGTKPRITASRLDNFYSCKFAYFLRYGLNIKNKPSGSFGPPEAGTFFHYLLENIVKLYTASSDKDDFYANKLLETCNKLANAYIDGILGGQEDKSARFNYQIRRLAEVSAEMAENVISEIRCSLFTPLEFELKFSESGHLPAIPINFGNHSMELVGKVDRIDGFLNENTLYLKVIDYKSGSKVFALSDIFHGLNAQLLIYAFAASEFGDKFFMDKLSKNDLKIKPCSILYIPTKEIISRASRDITDSQLKKIQEKSLKRSGIIVKNMEIIDALEQNITDDARFLPIKINKSGELSSNSSVCTSEQMEVLSKYVKSLLLNMGKEVMKGNIETDPYFTNLGDSCKFCEYLPACQYDVHLGDAEKRHLFTVDNEQFWKKIGGDSVD